VLKVLEQLHIPIDAIAGTSMGAVVGGLYASGFSPHEIESIMTSLNWQDAFRDRPPREDLTFRRKLEDQNFLVKFPLGIRGSRIQLPKGLIQGQKLNQTLRRLTLPVASVTDFDELPTPFRAVATDLETGDAVIMSAGDLTSAMRASMSAPGVFSPVERDGRLLVDGGIAENVPIDVAREMGVDILIVVDVGTPLLKRDKLSSAPVISNQMLAILIQHNSRAQLAKMTPKDVLIEPALGDTSAFDFGIVERVITTGEIAGHAAESRLTGLSVSAEEYAAYAAQRDHDRQSPPRIDFVKVDDGSGRYSNRLDRLFKDVSGKPLDPDAVARHVTTVYGQGNLEALDYRVVQDDDDRYGLLLAARRNSWGPNYVRFGLSLQDDFQGNSSYNAAARFVLSEITNPGGEWVWDLQVGETSLISTEVYLPISDTSSFFFVPHASAKASNVDVLQEQTRIACKLSTIPGFAVGTALDVLRVVSGGDIGVSLLRIDTRELSAPTIRETYHARFSPFLGPYLPRRAAFGASNLPSLDDKDLASVAALFSRHLVNSDVQGFTIAVQRFRDAWERHWPTSPERLLDIAIAMEAIFLNDGEDKELRFRLALRAARFLEPPGAARASIFDAVRSLYDLRSKIAHGADLSHSSKLDLAMSTAPVILRRSLEKMLMGDGPDGHRGDSLKAWWKHLELS